MAGLPTNSNQAHPKSAAALQQLGQLVAQNTASLRTDNHWQQVQRLGFPTQKQEDWKYTPLDRLLDQRFAYADAQVSSEQLAALALPLDAYRLVFIDGSYVPELSDAECGWYQVTTMTADASLPTPVQSEVFLHLTESLAQEVTLIRLAAGQHGNKPLYLLHISSGDAGEVVNTSHYRHHLVLEANTQADVVEHYVSLNDLPHFTGARLTVSVGDNAQLTHCKLAFETPQSDHFAHNDIAMGRDARASSTSFLLGAGLTRHHTSTQLNGEGATLSINSLLLPVGREVCDTRTYLEHNKGYCQSRQLHKTVVRERGKAVFNGMIKVAQHALKTDGQMTNNNLLLSKLAEVDTRPQLEIYADDVKCSHGATVGRIDAEQLFYLQSRGISQADAQQMIIFAFAAELTEAIGNDIIRQRVMERIADRLVGEQL
ncbi:Fe-S cluster assembly protein SufD [Yersinia ruckeri]|uniref:Fe-S cluster assembly protein SufD n=1 Tax=Yersinia ruckeri TaxID=29486 RepID=UPI001F40C424|nr:Fe-S cluster assembly protein SufD [Yersinia ruckeri]MCW6544349.1 Fe-S cluster assembly protein SufD [Yersinia ruckeri]MCW6570071.1 Fe-S cluster assembly protein SufD [Yersinia ruckeri]UIM99310.1 Fe-S cluster assembly protein SufD [Yersinia ruckeri]UZX56723.1 Fe-S cluster assembly protein SufD [Yersinia ruckeri]